TVILLVCSGFVATTSVVAQGPDPLTQPDKRVLLLEQRVLESFREMQLFMARMERELMVLRQEIDKGSGPLKDIILKMDVELQALRQEIDKVRKEGDRKAKEAASAGRAEINLFTLKLCNAADTTQLLQKLFPDGKRVRVVADERTNSIVVVAPREDLD